MNSFGENTFPIQSIEVLLLLSGLEAIYEAIYGDSYFVENNQRTFTFHTVF